MKERRMTAAAALLALALLAGCGERTASQVNLQEFYQEISEKYGMNGMVEVEGEMLDQYFPGLSDLALTQRVIYTSMISAAVNEYAFLQCADRADAAAAEKILRSRVDTQAEGGAWYPESMAAWSRAQVLVKDDYVLMIAAWEHADEIAEAFTDLA